MYMQYKSFVYLPIAFFLLLGGGILACYGIGRSNGRHLDEFPYISDTGVSGPERCLFTLVMGFGALFGFSIIHCYYKYVIVHGKQSGHNRAAWYAGVFACVGLTFVGSFQWDVLLVPHLIGAGATVLGAAVYSWLVVVLSWKQLVPHVHGKVIVWVRAVLAVLITVGTLLFGIGLAVSLKHEGPYRMISIISEWICVYSIIIFISTLSLDLHNVIVFKTTVVLADEISVGTTTKAPSQAAEVTANV